jgi:RNA polymerase sigma-70 factor (ECF subfamily)
MNAQQTALLRDALRQAADDLLAYFERRVSVRADAADLLGETMLQAWRRSRAVPPTPERQRMWLFTIAANVLANHRRSARRRLALADRVRQHLATSSEPDHAEADAVRDAVLRLGPAHRDLVMLVHWDGFSIVEAAELLGLNPSTARSRYAAAREILRTTLSPEPIAISAENAAPTGG